MRVLITADLHLTDRPLDAYRWEFFRWLEEQRYETLIILGDLADEKDYHSSRLVNQVVGEMVAITESDHDVHILMGNHDYSQPGSPFFGFLEFLPRCYYHRAPRIWEIGNKRWAFYPHSKNPERYVERMCQGAELGVDYTLCHQLFYGAVSERGKKLAGFRPGALEGCGRIFSGDVHVPQVVGDVEYVGAPYPIHFGDDYKPRVIRIGDVNIVDMHPPYVQKLVLHVTDPEKLEYQPVWQHGDQVKVVLSMSRSDFCNWEHYRKQVKRICDRNELVLCGIEVKEKVRARIGQPAKRTVAVSRSEQFRQFCKHAGVDAMDAACGEELLGES